MKGSRGAVLALALSAVVPMLAQEVKVDLKKETAGKAPKAFEPMVGTWLVAKDGADNVVMVDGRP